MPKGKRNLVKGTLAALLALATPVVVGASINSKGPTPAEDNLSISVQDVYSSQLRQGWDYLEQAKKAKYEESLALFTKSINSFEDILEKDPANCEAAFGKGSVLLETGFSKDALVYLQKAISCDKKEDVLAELASCYTNVSNYGKAQECIDEMLKINPKSSSAYWRLGHVYFAKNDFKNALEAYKNASVFDSTNPKINAWIGSTYGKLKEYEKAIEYLQKALNEVPDYAAGQFILGRVYEDKKEYEKALIHYQKASELVPEAINYQKKYEEIKSLIKK